jgi:hypothetical protein
LRNLKIIQPPSFPRRRESWLKLGNGLFLKAFSNIQQDSRLRGNDGISCFQAACCIAVNPLSMVEASVKKWLEFAMLSNRCIFEPNGG